MLSYNEVTPRKYILVDGGPYEVLASHVFRKQQRKPVNQTKIRHMITGKVTERSFHQSESVEEAEINLKKITYLFNTKGQWWFCEESEPSKRFSLSEDAVGPSGKFLREKTPVEAMTFNEKIIGLRLPPKMDLRVKEAPPGVKGDTAQGGVKQVTLETGVVVNAPLFINEGDIIRINTDTGEYTERVTKI